MKKWIFLPMLLIVACSSSSETPDNAYRKADDGRPLVDEKYSLQADRKALDEMRSQIPPEKKRENDELALVLGMLNETKKSPADVRNQFDTALRKKRSLFDKDLTKERETFTKEERKKREAFLKSQTDQRTVFNREKHSREERTEFFKDLDGKRSEFFSVERDKRNDFESDVRERRKSFEDYVREKQNDFNQEHKAYVKRYDEMKKQEREKAKEKENSSSGSGASVQPKSPSNSYSDEAQALEDELEAIKQRAGTTLQPGE
jgi:Skp family chaperone for outer membrane proteins